MVMRGQKQRNHSEEVRSMKKDGWGNKGTKPIKQQQWQRSEAGALVEPARF